MPLDLKSFFLGFVVATFLSSLGPMGWYGALLVILLCVFAWIHGGVRQSHSVSTRTNCRNCGAPNPPDRDECAHCGEPVAESDR